MNIPANLRYSKDHEWVRLEGDKAYIGITDYAQHEIGDVVFVEMPAVGEKIAADGVLGVVESVKATSDVFAPVGGTVAEVNTELDDAPEKINAAPYEAWIAVLEGVSGMDELLTPEEYAALIAEA